MLLSVGFGIMKAFGLWALFVLVGTALVCLGFSSKGSTSYIPGATSACHQSDVTLTVSSRKLKENVHAGSSQKRDAESVNIEDYHPIDPAPSSKASIRPGPIQHGTPLMPYIPKPSPPAPDHPKHGGFP